MATGPGFPGFTNVYIPGTNKDADGRLIVGFSRNPNKFGLPGYVQYTPVEQPVGYYLKITNQEMARVVNTQDFLWPDGQNRPQRNRDTESHNFIPFRCERYDYGFQIGAKTAKYSSWPIIEQHSQIKAAQCMTARTIRMITKLTTTSNWTTATDPDLGVSHTAATATAAGVGGSVYAGTSTDPRLKKLLDSIAVIITKDTNGVVGDDPEVFNVVINPVTARQLAEGAEVHDYLKGSPDALSEIKTGQSPGAKYGLPTNVYGYRFWVEKTVKITARVGASLVRSFVVPDNALLFLSRVGGLEGIYGAPSFSTATLFTLEEMSIESFDDPKNRLSENHVVEDVAEAVTCPASGYYVVDISS